MGVYRYRGGVVRHYPDGPRPTTNGGKTMGNDNNTAVPAAHTKGSGSYTKTVPKLKQRYQLGDWLRAHSEELHKDRPAWAAVAARVRGELGFDVSEDSIRNAAKALDMKWVPRTQGTNRRQNGAGAVWAHVKTAEARIDALRAAILNICGRVGETPPPMVTGEWPADPGA